jgi:hypothetical protein
VTLVITVRASGPSRSITLESTVQARLLCLWRDWCGVADGAGVYHGPGSDIDGDGGGGRAVGREPGTIDMKCECESLRDVLPRAS